MPDAFGQGDALCQPKGGKWRRGNVGHLVAWEKTTEMEGRLSKVVVGHPSAHLANLLHVVVDAGDDQMGQLYPHAGIPHGKYGLEHVLKVTATDFPIGVVAK